MDENHAFIYPVESSAAGIMPALLALEGPFSDVSWGVDEAPCKHLAWCFRMKRSQNAREIQEWL